MFSAIPLTTQEVCDQVTKSGRSQETQDYCVLYVCAGKPWGGEGVVGLFTAPMSCVLYVRAGQTVQRTVMEKRYSLTSSAVVPPPVFTQYTAMHMPFNHIPDVIQRHCKETWDPQGSSQGNEARSSPSPVRQRTWLPFHPQTASFGRRFVFCCLRTGWLGH